ncbi:MAG: SDR family NAD(P)-dependent oxidoreductase, partial [Oscillospiraceae bacterium]|nr:SDR family NAD(P)-dependent oxidoreductase [Oscillospiraceae bacterium]
MGRTALITGGSRGIGAACAVGLAQDGFDVIIGYNSGREEAERVAAETGGKSVGADVTDAAAVGRMLSEAGRVDVLVCCAGVAHYGLVQDISDDEWRRVIDVNIGGVINCCRAAIPGMVKEKSGRIILTSSIWGMCGASCEAVYSASKAAVIGLAKSLAKELG